MIIVQQKIQKKKNQKLHGKEKGPKTSENM